MFIKYVQLDLITPFWPVMFPILQMNLFLSGNGAQNL